MNQKKYRAGKIILVSVSVLLAVIVAAVGGLLIFESVTTLPVKDTEAMAIHGTSFQKADQNREIRIVTWNAGYGALDERQDCYWDGGKGVDGESLATVQANIGAMKDKIKELDPDVFCLQELDRHSKRSYHYDELGAFEAGFGDAYQSSFARNFKAGFIPLPAAYLSIVNNQMAMTYDSSMLLNLIKVIGSTSNQSTFSSVASLADSYDGMKTGFTFKKSK